MNTFGVPLAGGSANDELQPRTAPKPQFIEVPGTLEGTYDVARIMTLLMLMGFTESAVRTSTPLIPLVVCGLLFRQARQSWQFWLLMSAVLTVRHALNWHTMDNHQWLVTYWCFALVLSHAPDVEVRTLAHNARVLIGLCFAVAVIWKLSSLEFLNGSFFELALWGGDLRFAWIARVFGGIDARTLEANARALNAFMRPHAQGASLPAVGAGALATIGLLMTIWTLLMEAVLAICFLWPEDRGISRHRHAILLLFVLTTYFSAPVIGFGWLLIAMGMAQARNASYATRITYALAFAILPLFQLPFGRLIG